MKVPIEDFNIREGKYCDGDLSFFVVDIHSMAKNLQVFEIPLAGIDLDVFPWGKINMLSFCYHSRRMDKSDFEFPIILTPTGYICDGWHRVVRAILEGEETIKAVRLLTMPQPIE